MTDKELLDLAAKAAGYIVKDAGWTDEFLCRMVDVYSDEGEQCHQRWNPLTDDGDALRLAVKLGVVVDVRYGGQESHLEFNEVCYWVEKGRPYKVMKFERGIGPYAATRRAIVRAAAEIGKTL